jgi:hypothetical protein
MPQFPTRTWGRSFGLSLRASPSIFVVVPVVFFYMRDIIFVA